LKMAVSTATIITYLATSETRKGSLMGDCFVGQGRPSS
jgi:hypothetical protein